VREAVWDPHRFLGEEGREEDKGGKRVGCSPWRRVGIAGIAVLVDTSALTGIVVGTAVGIAVGMVAGTVASTLMGIALVKESSPPFPPQSTEASSEPA